MFLHTVFYLIYKRFSFVYCFVFLAMTKDHCFIQSVGHNINNNNINNDPASTCRYKSLFIKSHSSMPKHLV